MNLLTLSNTKTVKSQKKGYMTWIMHFSPVDSAGYKSVCPKASPGCAAGCLNYAGMGQTHAVQRGRQRKTRWFFEDRKGFMEQLVADIREAIIRSENKGFDPVFRLNGTSDILWERVPVLGHRSIFDVYPDFQFYDYTKIVKRDLKDIKNYHLTFSRSENNDRDCEAAIEQGMNVAAVFDAPPKRFLGRKVIDGEDNDLRFLDPKNVIVGLRAKGRARKDESGFVIRLTKA